jgi:signal transduction histidine kinase
MTPKGGWESRTEWAGLASDFAQRVLVQQVSIGVAGNVLVLLLAPWMLMLESQGLGELWAKSALAGAIGVFVAALLSVQRLRESRAVLQALALEPDRVEPEHVGMVADVPLAVTARFLGAGALSAALIVLPGLRPGTLDQARVISLALLFFTITSAASIVNFVVVRAATIRAIELGPIDQIAAWLEHESMRTSPQRRVAQKMLMAIVVPVAVVGVGSLLVAQAHLRAAVERGRAALALQVARVTFEAPDANTPQGRDDAMAAAAAHGFLLRSERGAAREDAEVVRLATDQLELRTALAEGGTRAVVRYSAELSTSVTAIALIAVAAVLLAALLGRVFGNALAADLMLASRQVSLLSTESVLRGDAEVAGQARFALVAQVGDAVETLTERFREFAAAQQRALAAKASAQRMKHLLFASVSHDLKSPLNAILGFCDLVREEPLTPAQIESLDMVSGRGRELLAMIETILDAARVEAGQLKLAPEPMPARELVQKGAAKAFDLFGQRQVEVVIELVETMPALRADPLRAPAALAVLLLQAMISTHESGGGIVRLRGTAPGDGSPMPRLFIEHTSTRARPSQLEMQLTGRSPTQTERGTALRLSLARAIIELHGGRVEVGRGARGEAVVTCWWPAA